MTPEGRVKDHVKRLLRRYGTAVHVHWPVQTGFGAPTLDCTGGCRIGSRPLSAAFAIETKAPGEKLTARQELTKASMEEAGWKVFVIGEHRYTNDDESQFEYSGMLELKQWLDRLTSR